MILILDTNVFYDDYGLQGTTLRILFEYLRKGGFRMLIPEVVFMETVNQVREKIAAAAEANNGRVLEMRRKTGLTISPVITPADIEELVNKYTAFLRGRLEAVSATIAEIPSISHKMVLERDLERKKPFTKNGKGYRDALIWETVLQAASNESDPIVFISKNSSDFADDEKKGLHPDLLSDLANHNIDPSKITLLLAIGSFVKETLIPKLPSPEQTLVTFMQKAHPTFSLESELADTFSEKLSGQEIEHHLIGKPSEFESITFSMVEHIYDIEIHEEHELSPNERILEIEAFLDCEFDAFIFKTDLWCMAEDEMPHVWDHDWNKHYAAVSFSETVQVQAYISLDMDRGKISSVEVNEIQGTSSSNM